MGGGEGLFNLQDPFLSYRPLRDYFCVSMVTYLYRMTNCNRIQMDCQNKTKQKTKKLLGYMGSYYVIVIDIVCRILWRAETFSFAPPGSLSVKLLSWRRLVHYSRF